MMELRHIAMVNWHLFDVEDIEITGHTGVFGENRSGKSTILDMAPFSRPCDVESSAAHKPILTYSLAKPRPRPTRCKGIKVAPRGAAMPFGGL